MSVMILIKIVRVLNGTIIPQKENLYTGKIALLETNISAIQ